MRKTAIGIPLNLYRMQRCRYGSQVALPGSLTRLPCILKTCEEKRLFTDFNHLLLALLDETQKQYDAASDSFVRQALLCNLNYLIVGQDSRHYSGTSNTLGLTPGRVWLEARAVYNLWTVLTYRTGFYLMSQNVVGDNPADSLFTHLALYQDFPNPFNASMVIRYEFYRRASSPWKSTTSLARR